MSPRLVQEGDSDFESATDESVAMGHKSWTGYYFSKKVKHELECEGLYLSPEKGTFHGDGHDGAGEFKWVGYLKDGNFLLKKKFENHNVFFWGVQVPEKHLAHNQEISLRGHWGFDLNNSEE